MLLLLFFANLLASIQASNMALELAPEIYLIIASFIRCPSTLSSCCRASKMLKKLFTPFLYNHIRILPRRIIPEIVYNSLDLACINRLDVQIGRRNEESVAKLSALLPNLVSLSVR